MIVLAVIVGLTGAPPPITLAEALARSDSVAYGNRIAQGQVTAQRGAAGPAWQGILPTLRVDGGWTRTTDPLNAFGFELRQRSITLESFDPARLNYPDPITNWGAATVAELPIFNADAWLGLSAAQRATKAVEAKADWSRTEAQAQVIRAYFGAVLAGQSVATLEQALAAARGHVRQAESMVRNGMVTKSDALLAQVKAGEIEARLAGALADEQLGRQRLAIAVGDSSEAGYVVPTDLPSSAAIRAVADPELGDTAAAARPDVAAAELALGAADADARRATSLYLPRINSFARYDWNSQTDLFGGMASWTVGVMASWSPFAGGSEIAQRRAANGRKAVAAAQADAARAQARLEQAQASSALAVAVQRLGIAERSVDQATEAHRIVSRMYEGGLASVASLLDAAAAETGSRLGLAAARFDVISALVEFRRVYGRDLTSLTALERGE